MFKKIFLSLTIVTIALLVNSSNSASAQDLIDSGSSDGGGGYTCGTDYTDPQCDPARDLPKAIKEQNRTQFIYGALLDTTYSISFALGGAPSDDSSGSTSMKKDQGLIGFMGNRLADLYNYRSISGVQYLASLNPIAPAQAAGTNTLLPILDLWKVFRNIAYIFLVVALIIFGFMVMFRYQLDPRTVISVSDALPRVIIALVLITFSFTIPGLFMDGEKVLESLVRNSLEPAHDSLKEAINKGGISNKDDKVVPKDPKFRDAKTGEALYPVEFEVQDVIKFEGFFEGLGDIFIKPKENLLEGAINKLAGGIAGLAVNFALYSLLVQLIFSMIRYFASFFILTIFGPIVILWSVLPGQEDTFQKWLSQLAVATIVFPAVFLMLNIAYYLRLYFHTIAVGEPYISGNDFLSGVPSVINSSQTKFTGSFLVLGIILITSKIPELIEEALRVAPKGSASRAGLDLKGVARKLPVVGGFM